jgi:uracil-DNA glycosylase family 4
VTLKSIAQEIRSCTRCELHKGRELAVPGEGPATATVMLIGEAPGREEDLTGRPFVGVSGKLLDSVLREAGLKRDDLFITSVVKCRPPRNRMPRKSEQKTCMEAHTRRQIQMIRPRIICLLGGVASKALLGIERIAETRGKIIRKGEGAFFVTYHPAAARRNPKWHQSFLKDMKKLRRLVEG